MLTPSDLKYYYQQANPNGHFFDSKTMRYFGDSMSNYGVRKTTIETWSDEQPIGVFELYRKRPVKGGLKSSAYFDCKTFEQRFAKK